MNPGETSGRRDGGERDERLKGPGRAGAAAGWVAAAVAVGVALTGSGVGGAAPGGSGPQMPVGSIVAFGGPKGAATEGDGWMLCDGRELAASTYPELHAVLGRAWGGAANGSTFRLPDLRGRFLRGVNYDAPGALRDPDAAARGASAEGGNSGNEVGTLQEDAAGPHTHPLVGAFDAVGQGLGAEVLRFFATKIPDAQAPAVRNEAAVQPPASAETRPRNVAVNWIIRVR